MKSQHDVYHCWSKVISAVTYEGHVRGLTGQVFNAVLRFLGPQKL